MAGRGEWRRRRRAGASPAAPTTPSRARPPFDPWFSPPDSARPLPHTLREHAIAVRTAAFVAAAAGGRTELALRAAHAGNPAFGFLDPGDARHAYYAWWRDVALPAGVPQAPAKGSDDGNRSPSPAASAGLAALVGGYGSDGEASSSPKPSAAARAQGPLPRPEAEEEEEEEDNSPSQSPDAATAAAAKRARRLAAARALEAERVAAGADPAAAFSAALAAAAAGTDADRARVVQRVRDALMSLDGG